MQRTSVATIVRSFCFDGMRSSSKGDTFNAICRRVRKTNREMIVWLNRALVILSMYLVEDHVLEL